MKLEAVLIMPFADRFNDVHEAIKEAIELVKKKLSNEHTHPRKSELELLDLYRVDDGSGAKPIMEELLTRMQTASLIIADISGNNPNVMWELGYAMALNKATIIITSSLDEAPFDAKSFRIMDYEFGNVSNTLIEPLANAIINMFRDVPESISLPDESGYAKILSMSTASPVYYLDSKFNIMYMNEAAVAIFLEEGVQTADSITGKSLRDFMNDIAGKLENLVEIEQNLQVQIANLQSSGLNNAFPLNVERVVLQTARYGIIEMQKTGIAVRSPYDGRIIGWVVSFNIVYAHDLAKFRSYYEKHKSILEGRILCIDKMQAKRSVSEIILQSDVAPARWMTVDSVNHTFSWANTYSEKQRCLEFMIKILLSDKRRYGLTSIDYLDKFFFDVRNTEYLKLSIGNQLLGLLRLHVRHDISMYANLSNEVVELYKGGVKFADAGVYLPGDTPSSDRVSCLGRFLGRSVSQLRKRQINALYAQVPTALEKTYCEFGFRKAGNEFECNGWSGTWLPIFVHNWNFPIADKDMARTFKREFDSSSIVSDEIEV